MKTGESDQDADFCFDPMSPEFVADPYPVYAALRKSDSFPHHPALDMLLVSRFKDVSRIATDSKMVRSMNGVFSAEKIDQQLRQANWHEMPHHSRFVQFSLLDSDGEVHDRLRKLVFMLFTPASIGKLRASIQDFVDHQFDQIGTAEIDFIEDFAALIPGHIIGQLIGVPKDDCAQLRGWSENIVQYFDVDRSDERKKLAENTTTEFYHYLCRLKDERRKQPQQDIISRLIEIEDAGMMNEDEFMSTCMLILMAGHGSTLDVLGTGLYNLLRYPQQMARLRRDTSLINTTVQEMLRYESPLPFFHRYAIENVNINGQPFEAGTKFGVLYGSANRDPEQFNNPDSFDVGRKPKRHLAFGGGAHFCLGNHLARLNMDIIFTSLLRRFANIELTRGEPEYKPGLAVRGLKNLHITLQPK